MFVSEKTAPKFQKITVEQAKRLVLQRDIDQESLPRQPLTSQRSVTVERPVEKVKMKVEEDKRGENHIKKEKKHKALGQASVLENKNCNVDVGSLADGKKEKKKSKKVETEEEPRDVSGGKKEKKKKRKIVNESQNDANAKDAKDEGVSKKKKKKKQQQLADDINQMEIAQISVKEDVEKKQRKKKVKNKTVQIIGENVNIQKEEEEVQQAGKDEVPKKAKKVKNKIAVSTEETEEQSKEKKKKKTKSTEKETTAAIDGITVRKKKPRVGKNEGTLETPEGETEVEEVKKKKRTKNEAKFKEDENGVETPEIKGKKKKSKAALGKVESEIVIVEEEKTEQRKKGKKEKCRKASVEVSEVEETEPKKKKKKKENKKGKEEPLLIKCEENEENGLSRETPVAVEGDATSKKSKKKKISVQAENNFRVESGIKKKRKIKGEVEDQQESSQEDVVFLSERHGNTDESQGRRQALQMEIDKASQPEKPAKPLGLGQWSTAQFNSSEQQQKFLRLMGGFKKGFQPAASTGGGNMAMGKDAQQQLQQGLLGEFERAHSRRMDFSNRGAGLGFTAPSNKKFSIDVSACRSVRFDD